MWLLLFTPSTVSGFYAEYPSKKMYLYGSMEIQSRFYGWYVRVNNIGNVTLVLMEHGEEYICTLPNAYARSVSLVLHGTTVSVAVLLQVHTDVPVD